LVLVSVGAFEVDVQPVLTRRRAKIIQSPPNFFFMMNPSFQG